MQIIGQKTFLHTTRYYLANFMMQDFMRYEDTMDEKKEYTISIGKNAGKPQEKEGEKEHQVAIRTSAKTGQIWRNFGDKDGN